MDWNWDSADVSSVDAGTIIHAYLLPVRGEWIWEELQCD
jgi:hypothetical protein